MITFSNKFLNRAAILFLLGYLGLMIFDAIKVHTQKNSEINQAANILSLKQDKTFLESIFVWMFADEKLPYQLQMQAAKINAKAELEINSKSTLNAVDIVRKGDLVVLSAQIGTPFQITITAGGTNDFYGDKIMNKPLGTMVEDGTQTYKIVAIYRGAK